MKTDRDMTENILNRVTEIKTVRAQRKRTIQKIASVTCVIALMFAMTTTFFGNRVPELPEDSTVSETQAGANKGFLLMVANAADESVATYSKENNVNIPLGGILQIKDTKGMSSEDVNKINYELKLRLEELYGLYEGFSITGLEGEVAVYFGTADKLRFKVEYPSAVDYITFSCSDKGELTIYDDSKISGLHKTVKEGAEITVTADEYAIYDKGEGMHLRWFLSDSYIETLTENTALSDISDTITGKVKYIDGTEELFTIALNFDDEGSLKATYCNAIAYYPLEGAESATTN